MIHELFSTIKTHKDVEKVINQYVNQGLISYDDARKIGVLIYKVVKHPELEQYYKDDVVVFNEREITTMDNEIVIPDRLVFNAKNEVTLIDYKTGKPSKRYHQQLLQYEKALKAMHLKVIKKVLIYINEEITIAEI